MQGMHTYRIAVLTLAVLIAGCSRSTTYVTPDGKVVVQQSGKPGQGQVTITGKDGAKMTMNAQGGKLPDDYPKDVPVAPNVKIVMSTSVNNAETQGVNLMLESTDTLDNLVAFYKKAIADNGWTIDSTTALSAEMTMFGASKDKRQLAVQIMDSNGKRTVTQTVATKP
jgi:hypothetical protein